MTGYSFENRGPVIAWSGSRTFHDQLLVERVMRKIVKTYPYCIIRVGDAKRGLDPMVAKEATRWGIWPDVQECWWPPEPATKRERWEAAHERNGRVITDAAMLIAFYAPGLRTRGTTDAVKQAKAASIPVWTYHDGKWARDPQLQNERAA